MKSFIYVFLISLNFYIKQSVGEIELEESNARHFIEGKVVIQGDKLPGNFSFLALFQTVLTFENVSVASVVKLTISTFEVL